MYYVRPIYTSIWVTWMWMILKYEEEFILKTKKKKILNIYNI